MGSEEAGGVELVGVGFCAEEDKVEMVGHENVGRAEKVFADAGVED